jgi:hypothetical protein
MQSPLNDPFQTHLSSTRTHTNKRIPTFIQNEPSPLTSFDIYGNELNKDSSDDEVYELESVIEELPKETIKSDKENNPSLSTTTPLKKREENRTGSARGSFNNNRSPLIDITPGLSVRKTANP